MKFFIDRNKLTVEDIERVRSVTEKTIGKNKDLVPDKIENVVIGLIKLINK
jgi:molybdopterin/thiamine biosynthesis adenylyltransferase